MLKLEHPSSGSVEALRPPHPLSLTVPPAGALAVPLPLTFSLMAYTGLIVGLFLFPTQQPVEYGPRMVDHDAGVEDLVFKQPL